MVPDDANLRSSSLESRTVNQDQNHGENGASSTVVLLAIPSEGYGIRRVWDLVSAGLADREFEPRFAFTSAGGLAAHYSALGQHVFTLSDQERDIRVASGPFRKPISLIARGCRQLSQAKRLARFLGDTAARALIVQSPMEVLLAAVAGRLAGVPTFWMMPNSVSDGYPLDLNRRLYRFLFRQMGLIPIANSHHTDRTLGPGNYTRYILHLGVDVEYFSPDAPNLLDRSTFGISEDAIVLGIFARLTPEKGQLVVLDALAGLGVDGKNIHLLVCGGSLESDFAQELRRKAVQYGISNRLHMTGPVEDIHKYYRICDVHINSRLDPEPFGLSVVEAMAMGRPVLAHSSGGPSETVLDGVTGWLVSDPSVEGFSTGISRAISDQSAWLKMGQAAREHVVTHFSDKIMSDRLCAIVRKHAR